MSELDLSKIEEMINSSKGKKAPIINLEFLVKAGFTLIMGSLAFAGISYKIDDSTKNIVEMKQYQEKQNDKWEIQKGSIILNIQTCQTEIEVMKIQIKQLEDNQNK